MAHDCVWRGWWRQDKHLPPLLLLVCLLHTAYSIACDFECRRQQQQHVYSIDDYSRHWADVLGRCTPVMHGPHYQVTNTPHNSHPEHRGNALLSTIYEFVRQL